MSERPANPLVERIRKHAVHSTLDQWRTKLSAERPKNFRELPDQPKAAYIRLRWVLRNLRSQLDILHPMLTAPALLDAVNKQISQFQTPWDQYRNNPKPHWQPLDASTDALLSHTVKLATAPGEAAWQENFDELRNDMESAIQGAQAAVSELQAAAKGSETEFQKANSKLEELATEIQAQKARLDQMLTQHSEAFTKAEQGRVTQFTNVEQDRAAKFTKAQEKQKGQHDALIAEITNNSKTAIENGKKEMADLVSSTQETAKVTLKGINDQLDKAVEIVGTIVKTTMSGNYQIIANREYKNAWVMRGMAIGSFVLMGLMVIWAVSAMQLGANDIEWRTFAFRLSIGFAFLIPGVYCAKEASRHWTAEKHNRRISLELAALDPFLVKLDEAKQKEIIAKKADEYFGRRFSEGEAGEAPSLKEMHFRGDQLVSLAQQIGKIIRG